MKKSIFLLIALALVAAACGGDSSEDDGSGDGGSTSIEVSGSSTVEPITALVAEDFSAANPNVAISTFTQSDIDSGQLIYVHNGSETTGDVFQNLHLTGRKRIK